MIRRCLLILSVFVSSVCFSQNSITGIWEGRYINSFGDMGAPKLVVEIYDFKDSMFTGICPRYV